MKIFNRWDVSEIKVQDLGLVRYINLKPVMIPSTCRRAVKIQFHKSAKNSIVERLLTKLMVPGHKGKKHKLTSRHCTGKGAHCYQIVEQTFSLIEQKLKKNPVGVFVKAVENAAPREEINTIEYGGARYPQAVECSPQRRVDLALRHMVQGAYAKSFNKKVKFVDCLADEIIGAYNSDGKSAAIAKKLELEKQADASR